MRLIISGGGTGGHVFPAIAIADAVQHINPLSEILFVGAIGRMEMKKVPEAGYKIIGLPIKGFQRKFSMENLKLFYLLIKSLFLAFRIVRKFNPDVVVGVGGYASGPVLSMAYLFRKPILIQEQNSFPGVTNRILSKMAKKICVAFDHMDVFFAKSKIIRTGNPVRKDFLLPVDSNHAKRHFGLEGNKLTIGVFGGSLGARSINNAMVLYADQIAARKDIQWIWQTGSLYYSEMKAGKWTASEHIKVMDFIDRMDLAYAACDIIISRAGALTLSELSITAKPSILVPSPNVAEDHQRKNAEAFSNRGASAIILDKDLNEKFWKELCNLIDQDDVREKMKKELQKMARPNAAMDIANEIISISKKENE